MGCEQPAVTLFVAKDPDHHVLGHGVAVGSELDHRVVVLNCAGLRREKRVEPQLV